MHYKKYIILILFTCLFSQDLFNRIIPEEHYQGDARSMGIGNTYLSTGSTAMLILSNPAKISSLDKSIYFQSSLLTTSHRRSMIIQDQWGDFLAETDYVFNQKNYLNHSLGFAYTIPIIPFSSGHNVKFGFGFIHSPLLSFNYEYEEEVRADSNLEDGIIGIDDPIIGYHTFKTDGNLYVQSLGISLSAEEIIFKPVYLALGIGINKIKSSTIKDRLFVNVVDNSYYDENNITPSDSFNGYNLVEDESYVTGSFEFSIKNHIDFILSFEEDVFIKTNEPYSLINDIVSSSIGLPLLFDFDEDNLLSFTVQGVNYNKPKKHQIGLLYKPKNNSRLTLAFEYTKKIWDKDQMPNAFNHDILEHRFGFEYLMLKGFPIRAGLVYSESIYKSIDPKSVLTLGTGKTFGKVILDVAMNYSSIKYKYYDLFPQSDIFDLSCDAANCDTIKENKLNFLTTIKVGF